MPYLIIDGDDVTLLSDGETLGEVSKDAVVHPLEEPVAKYIGLIQERNHKLANQLAGSARNMGGHILPLMRTAYFEGVEALGHVMTQPMDENGFRPRIADPYGDKINARDELRSMFDAE